MKKIIAIALALVLTCALAVTCFAATAGTGEVKATYVAGGTSAIVYDVDVSFGNMEFTYTAASQGTWDPETHSYKDIDEAAWTFGENQNKITVTNHSNVAIKATFTYTGEVETVYGTFTNDGVLALATAVGTARDAAPSDSVALTLGGSLTADTAGKVGTVTITIAKQ